MYIPNPVDLSDIDVPDEICDVLEMLAENVHENWALSRINEGWSYGMNYDGIKKIHPSLVPYDELPESEKDYDRITALDTIKLLIKNGFEIKLR